MRAIIELTFKNQLDLQKKSRATDIYMLPNFALNRSVAL